MFTTLSIRGGAASLLWGYRAVAVLTSYRITKNVKGEWRLSATLTRADVWQCQQAAKHKELLFTAPKDKGRWCWELADVHVGTNELTATLGKPLQ
jgi:hypothetical protein